MRTIESEIQSFEQQFIQGIPGHHTEKLCDFGYLVTPTTLSPGSSYDGKKYLLTVMGLTHGNEVAGVSVINETLNYVRQSKLLLAGPTAFILGNPEAARRQVRFLERDLNRSFNRQSKDTMEERRVSEIQPILAQSRFLLDFHQTMEPSETPFWIFPYSANGIKLAAILASDLPVITHWYGGFSQEGMCTDEFVNSIGGTGVTLELGQNGFSPYHIAVGFKVLLQALTGIQNPQRVSSSTLRGSKYFTWGEIIPFPDGDARLRDGLFNFKGVRHREVLGEANGTEIRAGTEGFILFPKYVRQTDVRRPTELCRIIKEIQFEDLGKSRGGNP